MKKKVCITNDSGILEIRGNNQESALFVNETPIQYTWFAEIGSTWRYHIAHGIHERTWGESLYISEILKHGAKTELQFNDIINYYSKFLKTGEYQFGLYDLHEHYEMIMLPEEEEYQSFDYYGGFPDIIPTQKTFNDKTVESYKELIQNNATPTMVIFHVIESAILFILDGHHKFLAYGQLRKKPRAIVITNLKTTTMTSEQAIKLAEKMNCEKENYHNSIKSEKKNHYFDFKLDLEKTYDDINE